jgi:tRNA dimethylallyltransferase
VAAKTDLKNPSRVKRALEKLDTPAESLSVVLPEFEVVKIGLQVSTPELNQCIATRVHAMIASGWVEEVKRLLARGVSVDSQAFQAIGYSPLASHITHGALLATTLDQVILETVQYAKRQRSWLRSERNLIWLHSVEPVHKVGETLAKQLRRVAIELT